MKYSARDLSLAGLFGALGVIVPILFHPIPEAGPIFLPMHLPILICGLLVSAPVALAVGVVTPLISSALTGMPPFVPLGVMMTLELAMLAVCASVLHRNLRLPVIPAIVVAMVAARLVAGLERLSIAPLLGFKQSFAAYVTVTVVEGWPGIVLQLVAVPLVMAAIGRISQPGYKGAKS